jgi:hypothetical protein
MDIKTLQLNFSFGIQQDNKNYEHYQMHFIKVLSVFLLFMIARTRKISRD